jgi:hypothetical protein
MREKVRQDEVRGRKALVALALLAPMSADASFLSGDALDTMANVLSWIVLAIVPLVAIAVFWYVHILPEVIAEKRHHPQKDSIKVLCILSLFFGGMLWPFAWLWAYTKPVIYRAAYGTDRHDDHYLELGEKARARELTLEELAQLRAELAGMAAKGTLSPSLISLRDEMDRIAPAYMPRAAAAPVPAAAPAPQRTEA